MADLSRITTDPEVLQGQPCIRGQRISVRQVLKMLADGRPWSEVLADYPDLEAEDIAAALAYAARNLPNYVPDRTPLQITRRLLNTGDIVEWAERVGFSPLRPLEELHATVIYSKVPIDVPDLRFAERELRIEPSDHRTLEMFDGGAVVLTFESGALYSRNREALKASMNWSMDEVRPHLTLAWGDYPDLLQLEAYAGELVFGPEVLKALATD
jgi:uncharacterized protein (DUF433 family)